MRRGADEAASDICDFTLEEDTFFGLSEMQTLSEEIK